MDQVIGANAGKIHLPGNLMGHQRKGWDLHHNAHREIRPEGKPFITQLSRHLRKNLAGPDHIGHTGNHREHHLKIPIYRGTTGSPKLGTEHLPLFKAQPQRPHPQSRILLVGQRQIRQLLVCADIHRTQRNRPRCQGLQRRFIGRKLLLLRGEMVGVHIEELTAEQSHTIRTGRRGKLPFIC